MRPILRFMLWLLIVVLPLQAGAALLQPCVRLSGPVAPQAHCAGEAPHGQPHRQTTDKLGHGKCTHCSACASMPGLLPDQAVRYVLRSNSAFHPVQQAGPEHIPAVIERPPRTA